MLSLVAGPFPLVFEGAAALWDTQGSGAPKVTWHDAVGLIGTITAGGETYAAVAQLDGVAYLRQLAGIPTGWVTHNFATGGLAFNSVAAGTFSEQFDLRALRPGAADVDPAAPPAYWTVLRDRYVQAVDGDLYTWNGSSRVLEATLDADAGHAAGHGHISRGPLSTLFAAFVDGRIYQYDWARRELVGGVRYVTAGAGGLWYSLEHGVFVGVYREDGGTVDNVRIFADEPAPDSMTDPAPVSTLGVGRATLWQVQVVGDAGEACAGVPVNWTVDVGTVTPATSLTDASGIASTTLEIPNDTVASDVTVTAEAVF